MHFNAFWGFLKILNYVPIEGKIKFLPKTKTSFVAVKCCDGSYELFIWIVHNKITCFQTMPLHILSCLVVLGHFQHSNDLQLEMVWGGIEKWQFCLWGVFTQVWRDQLLWFSHKLQLVSQLVLSILLVLKLLFVLCLDTAMNSQRGMVLSLQYAQCHIGCIFYSFIKNMPPADDSSELNWTIINQRICTLQSFFAIKDRDLLHVIWIFILINPKLVSEMNSNGLLSAALLEYNYCHYNCKILNVILNACAFVIECLWWIELVYSCPEIHEVHSSIVAIISHAILPAWFLGPQTPDKVGRTYCNIIAFWQWDVWQSVTNIIVWVEMLHYTSKTPNKHWQLTPKDCITNRKSCWGDECECETILCHILPFEYIFWESGPDWHLRMAVFVVRDSWLSNVSPK